MLKEPRRIKEWKREAAFRPVNHEEEEHTIRNAPPLGGVKAQRCELWDGCR
jgi:hypothetical protein